MKNQKSFTLIELLLYMALLSFLLVFITDVLTNILNVRTESESVTSVEQDGKYLLNRLMYDISRAGAIVNPNLAGTESTTMDLTINGSNYHYEVIGGYLQITAGASPAENLNSVDTVISNLKFKNIELNTIKVQFTLTSRIVRDTGPETRNYETVVGLR